MAPLAAELSAPVEAEAPGLGGLGALVGLLAVALYASRVVPVVMDPEPLVYTEGVMMLAAQRVAAGASLWGPLDAPPFVYFAYPPLVPWLLSPLTALGPSLVPARALAAASYGLAAVVAGLVAAPRAWGTLGRGLGAALVLVAAAAHPFAAMGRVDQVEVCLLVLTLVAWSKAPRSSGWLWVGAAALALTGLSKWTGLVPLGWVAAMGGLRRREGWRATLLSALVGAALWGLACAALHRSSAGAFTEQVFLDQGASEFRERARYVALFLISSWPLVLLTALGFSWRAPGPWTSAAIGSFLWFLFAQTKQGADLNYSLEPQLLLAAAAVAGLERAWARLKALTTLPQPRRGLAQVLLVGLVAALVFQGRGNLEPVDRRLTGELRSWLARAQGPLLIEEPAYAALLGREVWVTDVFQTRVLYQQGRFDPRPLEQALASGQVRWVVAGPLLVGWTPVRDALALHYERVANLPPGTALGAVEVYRWRAQ